MIVFLDMQQKKIKLYSENGEQVIPFNKADLVQQIIGDKEVLYVTNAVKTTGNEVFKTVLKLTSATGGSVISSSKTAVAATKNEPMFIRSKKSNIIIQDLDLSFGGPYDFIPLKKLFDKYGKNVLKDHALLNRLIQQGFLEILTITEVQYYTKQQAEKQSQKDKQLDSILVDESVDSHIQNSASGSSVASDAIEIDLLKGGGFGGGATSNEGSLLPADFDQ